jgi:hypothetical protein
MEDTEPPLAVVDETGPFRRCVVQGPPSTIALAQLWTTGWRVLAISPVGDAWYVWLQRRVDWRDV